MTNGIINTLWWNQNVVSIGTRDSYTKVAFALDILVIKATSSVLCYSYNKFKLHPSIHDRLHAYSPTNLREHT